MKPPSICICVTTYNNSEDLLITLDSIKLQSIAANEICICDDGSSQKHKKAIMDYLGEWDAPVQYIWHEDKGWSLSRIRNKGIINCRSEYIIFCDGDIVLHPKFIEDYISLLRPGEFIIGPRCHVSVEHRDEFRRYSFGVLLGFLFRRKILKRKAALRNRFCKGLLLGKVDVPSFISIAGIGLGVNHGFWKRDALAVRGYDERFKSWGPEDSDFAFRMLNKGLRVRILSNRCLCFHRDHQSNAGNVDPELTAVAENSFATDRTQPFSSSIVENV